MRRRINFRFLACIIGVAAFFAVGGHFLQAYQVGRNAGDLKNRAARAWEAAKDETNPKDATTKYVEAMGQYRRYLQLVPGDGDARADYGLCLAHEARTGPQFGAAADVLEQALRLEPERDDARRRLVEVLLLVRSYANAHYHLRKLTADHPNDPDLEHLRGRCLEEADQYVGPKGDATGEKTAKESAEKCDRPFGAGDKAEGGEGDSAVVWYWRALWHQPGRIDTSIRLAGLLRDRHRLNKAPWSEKVMKLADEVMNELVANNKSYQARVVRARYYRTGGSGSELEKEVGPSAMPARESLTAVAGGGALLTDLLFRAELDLSEARAMAPDDADVLLESAEVARARQQFEQAKAYALQALHDHPDDVRMYGVLAHLAGQSAQRKEVLQKLRDGVTRFTGKRAGADLMLVLVDLLIDSGNPDDLKEANDHLRTLEKQGATDSATLDFMDGRTLCARGQWLEGSYRLERALPGLQMHRPAMARQCNLLLGKCYEQLEDPVREFRAYQRARTNDPSDPLWFAAADGVARAHLALNHVDEAVDIYREMTARAPGARLVVARLLLGQNLLLPPERRQWAEIDKQLKAAELFLPRSTELAILSAQVLFTRDPEHNYESAKRILDKARTDDPDDAQPWIALAGLEAARNQGTPAAAISVLEEAEKRLPDSVDLRLARVRYLLLSDDKRGAAEALGKIEDGAKEAKTDADRLRLLVGLVDGYTALGEEYRTKARSLWEEIARKEPKDIAVRLRLFDLALLAEDDREMQVQIGKIQELEGKEGFHWRYAEATRLVFLAQKRGDRQGLDEAKSLLNSVAGQQHEWRKVFVCRARAEALSGEPAAAIKDYLSAIDKGERTPAVILEAVRLLIQNNKDREAGDLLQKLPEQSPERLQVTGLEVELALRTKELDKALELAKKAAAANQNDYQARLTLGHVYLGRGEQRAAEREFRKAQELKDDVPATWGPLILLLAQSKDRVDEAKDAIKAARQKVPLETNRLVYAQWYEAVGDAKTAGELYEAAKSKGPNDPATLLATYKFYLRSGKTKEAEEQLKKLWDLREKAPQEAAEARRVLGFLIAADTTATYEEKRERLREIGFVKPPAETGTESVDDRRARAILLAVQGGHKNIEGAVGVLEEMKALQPPLTTADQFLLAQLYDALGGKGKTKSIGLMAAVVEKEGDNPQYVETYARALLAHEDVPEAAAMLVKLEKLQKSLDPKPWRTVDLRARVLAAQDKDMGGKAEEAVKLLEKYADRVEDAPLLAIAALMDQIEPGTMKLRTKNMYDRWIKKSGNKGDADLVLAVFYARNQLYDQALKTCDDVRRRPDTSLDRVISVALQILYQMRTGKETQDRVAEVETWIADAIRATEAVRPTNEKAQIEKDRRLVALQQTKATLLNLKGTLTDEPKYFDEAEATYRAVLQRDSRDVLALNNLAWLLATKGKNPQKDPQEALVHIKKAIEIKGPDTELLDTRAIVYLALGDSKSAIADLDEVLSSNPTGTAHFHMAEAQFAAKDLDAVSEHLRKAEKLHLNETALHPFERAKFKELMRDYGTKAKRRDG
jgi:tetratricopeptide (TPR) repeat protein